MICLVNGPNGEQRLVRAKSNKAAIDFVVGESYKSKAQNADEVVDLMAQGLKVEEVPDDDEDKVVAADPNANTAQPAETDAGASFNG